MDVFCQMVNEKISADLCEAEQGGKECTGCAAETRRCASCSRVQGIADPELGLCPRCHAKHVAKNGPNASVLPDTSGGTAKALEQALSSITNLLGFQPEPATEETAARSSSKKANVSAEAPEIVKNAKSLFATLTEHAEEYGGTWCVRNPLQTLAVRVRLTPEEAKLALDELVKQRFVEMDATHSIAKLLQEFSRPQTAEETPRVPARRGPGRPRKLDRDREVQTPRPPSSAPAPQRPTVPVQPTAAVPVAKLSSPGKTYADVYSSLVERAQMVSDERLVRGVIPLIQMRWRINAQDTFKVLEKLQSDGHIAQRDGWRSIALLAEQVTDQTPLSPKEATSHGTAAAPFRPVTPRQHLRVIPSEPPAMDPVPMVPVAAVAPSVELLDVAIRQLEERLPDLRTLRDDVNQKVATLEASLAALRAARSQYREVDAATARLLEETSKATSELLQTLRGGR